MTTYKCPQYLLKAGFTIGKYGGGLRIKKHRRPKLVIDPMPLPAVPAIYPTGAQDVTEILRVTVTA